MVYWRVRKLLYYITLIAREEGDKVRTGRKVNRKNKRKGKKKTSAKIGSHKLTQVFLI